MESSGGSVAGQTRDFRVPIRAPRPSPTSRPTHQGPLANPVRDQALARIAARARAAQGWCPTIIDTNGDGRITRPWNSGSGLRDPNLDTQLTGFAYGIIVNPVDGSIWITRTGGVPGRIFRLELGGNPPETCKAEVYEPPFETPALPQDEWGFSPRGIDVARDGIIWTALSGSGHLASFDRTKCAVLKGPEATGQHCPEGWTLYPTPGPQMTNVATSGSATGVLTTRTRAGRGEPSGPTLGRTSPGTSRVVRERRAKSLSSRYGRIRWPGRRERRSD